jgi:hypothetical protein
MFLIFLIEVFLIEGFRGRQFGPLLGAGEEGGRGRLAARRAHPGIVSPGHPAGADELQRTADGGPLRLPALWALGSMRLRSGALLAALVGFAVTFGLWPVRNWIQTGEAHPFGVDVDQKLIGGARYRDKRPVAERMWQTVMEVLAQIGALPKAAKW